MNYIKKGFDCKKNRICFETAHTKKIVLIKTGFTGIKKGFSKIKVNLFFCASSKKTKEKKSFSSNRVMNSNLSMLPRYTDKQRIRGN